jgi:phosphoesterase RecJ-like protein
VSLPPAITPALAEAALERLTRAKTVLMPTHPNVDADGLATPLALMHMLKGRGIKAVPLVSDSEIPRSLRFLPGIEQVVLYGQHRLPEYDLLCLLDASDRKRLGGFYTDDPSRIEGGVPIINIDHHVTNERYGEVAIVDPRATSTSEVMFRLMQFWGEPITPVIAQCLLAGIYGDTLALRTEGTTPETMRIAAALIEAGANPSPIIEGLFILKPPSTVCLWERALSHIHTTGQLIWTEVTEGDLAECNAKRSESEGIVNFLLGTEGTQVAAILYEQEDGWRVSMRSLPPVDVAAIAAVFGGGGHPRAAGCSLDDGQDAKWAFIDRVNELIANPPVPPGVS